VTSDPALDRAHRRRRFTGRDPDETHRAASPLELLYDLTFVIGFGVAADELAHYVAEDHIGTGVIGFCFAVFAVTWAWINYSWFASAYDTDDWVFRLATMVQMVGVIVLALGLQQMFASIDHGDTLDIGVMVAGYVVMRLPMVFLWSQAARHDPERRRAALTYIWTIAVAQVLWVAIIFPHFAVGATFALMAIPLAIEFTGPWIAERRRGGTPWHAGHIAERYGLLVIITLGEGIIGTVASLNAVVHGDAGWTVDAALLAVAGIGLTFGAWWMYFVLPWAAVLTLHRERAFRWGYGHLLIFGALAAMGAGLHVAAYYLEHESALGVTATVASVVVPFAIFTFALYGIYSLFMREADPFHLWLLAGTIAVLVATLILAAAGVGMPVCLLVLVLAPVVTIVGYEVLGYRHVEEALERQRS